MCVVVVTQTRRLSAANLSASRSMYAVLPPAPATEITCAIGNAAELQELRLRQLELYPIAHVCSCRSLTLQFRPHEQYRLYHDAGEKLLHRARAEGVLSCSRRSCRECPCCVLLSCRSHKSPGPTPITAGASVIFVPRLFLAMIASTTASGFISLIQLPSGQIITGITSRCATSAALRTSSTRQISCSPYAD